MNLKLVTTSYFSRDLFGEDWVECDDQAYLHGLWVSGGTRKFGYVCFTGDREFCEKFQEISGWSGGIKEPLFSDGKCSVHPSKGDKIPEHTIDAKGDLRIPEFVFCSSPSSRIAFIQGYMDGHSTLGAKTYLELVSRSEGFIRDLAELFHTLGMFPNVTSKAINQRSPQTQWKCSVARWSIPEGISFTRGNKDIGFNPDAFDRNTIDLDIEHWVHQFEDIRTRSSNKERGDYGTRLISHFRRGNPLNSTMLEKFEFLYNEIPKGLSGLIGYAYARIESFEQVVSDVYDLTVPEVHEFYAQGTWNHNTTLSKIFAKAVNCKEFKSTGDVCSECDPCKEVAAINSQMYLELDSSVVGNVESIRALKERLSYYPQTGRRVVVFDESHAVSNAAQNSLLKMIEDGVPNTFFLFASTNDVIPTIKSRSLCLDISLIPTELIANRVTHVAQSEGIEISHDSAYQIAMKSGGHMRNALSILQLYQLAGESALSTSYHDIIEIFKFMFSNRRSDAIATLDKIMMYPVIDILNSINLFIKNCFLAKQGDPLYQFQSSGLIYKIYSYVYTPVSQQALKDEFGVELFFRAFIDKLCK